MTTFKVPNKKLTILRENYLKLLHINESLVTYWRLPIHFQWKAFLLRNLKIMKVSKLPITKLQNGPQFWWLFSLWWFTQFGVLLSPIALKGGWLVASWLKFFKGWHQSSFPIPYMETHKQGNKETSNNQRPKNEMKVVEAKIFWCFDDAKGTRFSSFIQDKNPRYPRNSWNMIKIIPRVLGRKFQVETTKGFAKGFNLKCFLKEFYSLVIDYQKM